MDAIKNTPTALLLIVFLMVGIGVTVAVVWLLKRASRHRDGGGAAERFNRGEVRFLVSTEAGGEGIDLQERCHSLVHVDLPWNPMRLHERVGRLNRYRQKRQVEVVSLRNPDTVEARI